MNETELSTALEVGWSTRIVIPRRGNPALTWVAVLEPRSGNLGFIDLATGAHGIKEAAASPSDGDGAGSARENAAENEHVGSIRSLGSVVPAPGAFCGDVYELPTTTSFLPSDFRALNAVGSVFTDSFDVSEQVPRQGVPGSTRRSEWFGVDYYGEFWVRVAGEYEFVLDADDSADLYIDDRRIITDDGIHPPETARKKIELEAGRHTIHLPYFEGPKYVNLILQIKPPSGDLRVFDIRDYRRPAQVESPAHLDQSLKSVSR